MKTHPIKLQKTEAITIARLSLIEQIVERPGIWTHLNKQIRVQRRRLSRQMQPA